MMRTLPTEGYVQTTRLRLHMRREGKGPALLFLGGSNFDMRLRAPVFASALPAHFDVIAYEPRGLARSDAPPGDWTMRDYADDAASLLDALNIPRALVLGESFGGMTALHLATHHPDRVQAFGVMAATAGGVSGRSYPIEEFLSLPVEAAARAALRLQDSRFAELETRAPALAADRIAKRIALETAFRACPANAAGYPRLLAARAGHDATALLDQITCPAIIMAGRHDGQAPLASVQWLAEHLPDAIMHEFDGGHGFGFATPEPMRCIIDQWSTASPIKEALS